MAVATSAASSGANGNGHAPVLGEGAEAERGGAGQRELGQRDLAGVAGHDDEREPDDRGDERADDRGAPGARRRARGPATPTAAPTTVGTRSDRGRGARPSGCRTRPPRAGIPPPTTTQRDQDDDQRHQLGRAGLGHPRVVGRQRQRLGLQHADGEAGAHDRHEVLEPADDRGGQGRDDEQGVGDRRQRVDRGDEDAGEPGDHRADHPVERARCGRARRR